MNLIATANRIANLGCEIISITSIEGFGEDQAEDYGVSCTVDLKCGNRSCSTVVKLSHNACQSAKAVVFEITDRLLDSSDCKTLGLTEDQVKKSLEAFFKSSPGTLSHIKHECPTGDEYVRQLERERDSY